MLTLGQILRTVPPPIADTLPSLLAAFERAQDGNGVGVWDSVRGEVVESCVPVDDLFGGVLEERRNEELDKCCLLCLVNLMFLYGRVGRKLIGAQARLGGG